MHDFRRERTAELDPKIEALAFGHVAEGARAVILQLGEADATQLDVHFPGFDLAQIQNVVDEGQQVGSRGVDGLGELDLLGGQILIRVLGQHAGENEQVVERRAELMTHIRQEFALVFGCDLELFGLFFEGFLGLLDFLVLGFDFGLLLGQQLGFFLQFGIGLLQLKLLAVQFFG